MARSSRSSGTAPAGVPAEPAFWFGFEVTWAKLATARVLVFALLALDALAQLPHAPRYGAGGFNVGQLAIFDALGPTRTSFAVGELVNAYCFVLVACGVATRALLPVATLIYSWLYFGSQLDSYQHHYLVWLVLVLACFVPWSRPPDAAPPTRIASWALRLVVVQLALVYAWAAVSKMNAAWIDGRTLAGQIGGLLRPAIDATIGTRVASWGVIAVELVLAATVWNVRTWWLAAPLGLVFHASIVAGKLEIGLFAWLMLALYVLVIPDRVWVAIYATRVARALRAARLRVARAAHAPAIALGAAAAITLATAVTCRFPEALPIGVGLAVVTAVAVIARGRQRVLAVAVAHALALAGWLVVDRATTIAADYDRFWGGSSRRLGDLASAERGYRALLDIAPHDPGGHYQLGRVLVARGADEDGIAELHVAEQLEPARARAYVAEARALASRGRRDEARRVAHQAIAAEPTDGEARALVQTLDMQHSEAPTLHDRGSGSERDEEDQ